MTTDYIVLTAKELTKIVPKPLIDNFLPEKYDEEGNVIPFENKTWEELLDAMQAEFKGGRGYDRTKAGEVYRVIPISNPRFYRKVELDNEGNVIKTFKPQALPSYAQILTAQELEEFGFDVEEIEFI